MESIFFSTGGGTSIKWFTEISEFSFPLLPKCPTYETQVAPSFIFIQLTYMELQTLLVRGKVQLDLRDGELGLLCGNVRHLQAACSAKLGLQPLKR